MKNQKNKNYCVIMAGGIGSRFWPLSRTHLPKQFVDILGEGKTFMQLTYERFSNFIPDENFLVMTGEIYKDLVKEQLPMLRPEQILTEPARRNTAPCIAYATYKIFNKEKDANIIVTPSDQYVGNIDIFQEVVQKGINHVSLNKVLLTIGIKPSYPATNYGYIEYQENKTSIYKVSAFKEKPELARAKDFLAAGNFLWNSGMFIWNVQTIAKSLETFLPDIANAFKNIPYNTIKEKGQVHTAFINSQSISIDYGVMEKATNVDVIHADYGWNDIGSWGALYRQLPKDFDKNVISGDQIQLSNSNNCLIKNLNCNKKIIVNGVDNLIIVDTEDILMITPFTNENELNKFIERVSK